MASPALASVLGWPALGALVGGTGWWHASCSREPTPPLPQVPGAECPWGPLCPSLTAVESQTEEFATAAAAVPPALRGLTCLGFSG